MPGAPFPKTVTKKNVFRYNQMSLGGQKSLRITDPTVEIISLIFFLMWRGKEGTRFYFYYFIALLKYNLYTIKIHLFKICNSVLFCLFFSIFTGLCNHHHYLILGYFLHFKSNSILRSSHSLFSSSHTHSLPHLHLWQQVIWYLSYGFVSFEHFI